MHEVPNPSFEAIHLVSFLLVRFNSFVRNACWMSSNSTSWPSFCFEGENTKTDQRLLLRGDVTRLLKAVYGSTDNQISQWVADLCSKGFLDAVTLNTVKTNSLCW